MTPPLPLGGIRLFDGKSHRAALWWLAVLYRRPKFLAQQLKSIPHGRALRIAANLYLHSLPYVIVVSIALRPAIYSLTGRAWDWQRLVFDTARGIAGGIAGGIAVGVAYGIYFGTHVGIAVGIAVGVAYGGIYFGTHFGIAGGIAMGIIFGIAFGREFAIPFGIAVGIASGIDGGTAVGISFGIAAGIAGGVAGSTTVQRIYYLLAHPFFIWPKVRGRLYPFHPVAWDDCCSVPFPGLARLLVAFAELHPSKGEAEIERLVTAYPSQRMEALRARMTLLARSSKRMADLSGLADVAAHLPHGEGVLLGQSRQVAESLGEIVIRHYRLNTAQRAMLREPLAEILVKEIENFRNRIAGFKEPLASEFRAAALEWGRVATRQLDEARSVLQRKPVGQVFRAGDPVNREGEAFVYRDAVIGRLDQQVMLGTGCPGIVLYARRRMGKSTLLANLDGFLPPTVMTRVISMQDATAFTSLEHFVGKISEGETNGLSGLSQYLSKKNEQWKAEGKRLLLALDEYENIDIKIGEKVFSKDLLAVMRESIQQHRHIIWLLAGSHGITELKNAEWPSYLVSARTIEIPPFTLDETRLLLTDPLKHSQLFAKARERPRFNPEIWGPGGIERIHAEAGGWPHLLQLIAETLVDFLNNETAPAVTPDLMERALDEATLTGQNVFYQLMRGECSIPGEWEYLSAFRRLDEQEEPEEEAIRDSLLRRQLMTTTGSRWRLRVPLMARWLRLRG